MNAATTIAAARVAARRRIVRRLEGAGATAAADAVSLEPGRLIERRVLQSLVRAGAVREAGGNRYWLDVEGYDAYRRTTRKRAFGAMGAVLAIAGLGIALSR